MSRVTFTEQEYEAILQRQKHGKAETTKATPKQCKELKTALKSKSKPMPEAMVKFAEMLNVKFEDQTDLKKPKMKKEESLQIAVCDYIRLQYPKILFTCDLSSGIKLTIGQAVKAKKMRSNRGMPDLMIFETIKKSEEAKIYSGLVLELKTAGTRLINKSGEWADEHISEQADVLKRFAVAGYMAKFAIGFDDAQRIIDDYLGKTG